MTYLLGATTLWIFLSSVTNEKSRPLFCFKYKLVLSESDDEPEPESEQEPEPEPESKSEKELDRKSELEPETDLGDPALNNSPLGHINPVLDPAFWPKSMGTSYRDYLLINGPPKITLDTFPKDKDGRHFSKVHCERKLNNGEHVMRPWLIYSESEDMIYCFYILARYFTQLQHRQKGAVQK